MTGFTRRGLQRVVLVNSDLDALAWFGAALHHPIMFVRMLWFNRYQPTCRKGLKIARFLWCYDNALRAMTE